MIFAFKNRFYKNTLSLLMVLASPAALSSEIISGPSKENDKAKQENPPPPFVVDQKPTQPPFLDPKNTVVPSVNDTKPATATNAKDNLQKSSPGQSTLPPLQFIDSSPIQQNVIGQRNNNDNKIPIRKSAEPRRGINVNPEVPSVRHVTMAPASKVYGGDDVEIVISPIYNILIEMPDAVEHFDASSTLLSVTAVATNSNMLLLKLGPVEQPMPISLHIVDINQHIYTFTVIGAPADLSWEYPKTIIVNKKNIERVQLGTKNMEALMEGMSIDDAVQMVVGDVPNTDEYQVELVSSNFLHHKGYVQYGFRIYRRDQKKFPVDKDSSSSLKFTVWGNNKRLDSGSRYALSKDVEWVMLPILSDRETRRKGYEVLRVYLQIRSSILDLEDWKNAFLTISDSVSYTRFDFAPLRRDFRAPPPAGEE